MTAEDIRKWAEVTEELEPGSVFEKVAILQAQATFEIAAQLAEIHRELLLANDFRRGLHDNR